VALVDGQRISPNSLPDRIRTHAQQWIASPPTNNGDSAVLPEQGINLEEHIQKLERSYLLAALERCGGVRTLAANMLGMSYRSFRHYAKKYGV
jgi:two-component system, NtrC family, response regulator PilR